MTCTKLLGALLAILGYHATAQATQLINNTGLVGPSQVLTFSEVVLPSESLVTNQYAGFGVTFSPGMFYNTQPFFFPTPSLANFNFSGGLSSPSSIVFSQDLTEVALAVQTTPGTTIFSALLNNIIVESFTAGTTSSTLPNLAQASNFYGFTNIVFDEIRILPNTTFFQMDNLQLTPSSVPEPGTLALLGLGLAGLFVPKRRTSA